MPSSMHMLPLARAATLMETGNALRAAVMQWGHSLQTAREVDGVDAAVADGLLTEIHERGICWRGPGQPVPVQATEQQAEPLAADLLRPAAGSKHALSVFLRISANVRYQQLLSNSDERTCTRLRSAGGATAGKSLVAPAGLREAHFTDDQLQEVLWWRLGCSTCSSEQRCQNFSASTQCYCHEPLGEFADHAAGC